MTFQAQIFGFTDCQETRKAQRFFQERGVTVHFVDLKERPAARGELRRFEEKFGAAALIDREGALFKALSVFALRDISLSKIESRPVRGRPWEYVFYADFLRGDDLAARNALHHLAEVADLVKVLGVYPSA